MRHVSPLADARKTCSGAAGPYQPGLWAMGLWAYGLMGVGPTGVSWLMGLWARRLTVDCRWYHALTKYYSIGSRYIITTKENPTKRSSVFRWWEKHANTYLTHISRFHWHTHVTNSTSNAVTSNRFVFGQYLHAVYHD